MKVKVVYVIIAFYIIVFLGIAAHFYIQNPEEFITASLYILGIALLFAPAFIIVANGDKVIYEFGEKKEEAEGKKK